MDRHQPALDQVGLRRPLQPDGDVGLAHAEVDLAVGHHHRDADVGIELGELGQMRRQPDGADADRGAQPEMAARLVAALVQRRLDHGHAARHLGGGLQHDLALLGQHEAARMPVEQRDPEMLLERADLPADRRLAQPQPVGGTGEAPSLRDGVEDADSVPIERQCHVLSPALATLRGLALTLVRIRCSWRASARPRVRPCSLSPQRSPPAGTLCPARRRQRTPPQRSSACCPAPLRYSSPRPFQPY